jgi:hypothetical protein
VSNSLKLQGRAWSNFIDVELAPQTKSLYSRWVQIFMQYSKIDEPDKLLQLGTVREIEDKIIEWLGTLKESGKATATMRTALSCIIFFYSCNRVKLDGKFIGRRIPKKAGIATPQPHKRGSYSNS